jgi:hypothetical protein
MSKTLAISDIDIEKREVCRYLGYAKGQSPTAPRSSLIDNQTAEAYGLIEPSYSCVIKKVKDVEGPRIFIEESVVLTSNVIARIFSKCHEVAVFVTTLGSRLEEKVSQLMSEGEILKAVVLDAVGSEAVEKIACWIEGGVRERAAAHDVEVSLRFSPGYCDWDIRQQRGLFRALDGDLPGVELTEDCLMIPRKSISGIIGIGFDQAITLSPCFFCGKKDCPHRRT